MARNALLAILVWLAVAFLPTFLLSNYHIFQVTLALAYSIALLGLNMLTGYNGQIALGKTFQWPGRRLHQVGEAQRPVVDVKANMNSHDHVRR